MKAFSWGRGLALAGGSILSLASPALTANEIVDALQNGGTTADIRLRSESVDQDNLLKDADALTVRTRLTYSSAAVNGFSTTLEMEDVRIVAGQDDYSVGPTGFKPVQYSVIADPETTELDQAFIQYKNDLLQIRGGRQVITYNDHRFVGDVGWRQDRQTFDGLSATISPMERLSINYAYLSQRNRIFAEAADIDSSDHLLNAGYKTPFGELTGFAYLLEEDDSGRTLDTYGIRFIGDVGNEALNFNYALSYASQSAEVMNLDYDAPYLQAQGGIGFGPFNLTLAYEVLGSDDGNYGFATPLATLHKFNGWADMFLTTPAQGLVDKYLSAGGKIGKGNWVAIYHDFEADESTAAVDDFGSEWDLQFKWPLAERLSVGITLANYKAGDAATGLVDTDKLWFWGSFSF